MHLWDRNEYFQDTNRRNDIVKRALRFLEEEKTKLTHLRCYPTVPAATQPTPHRVTPNISRC